jgi:hypothetical protein
MRLAAIWTSALLALVPAHSGSAQTVRNPEVFLTSQSFADPGLNFTSPLGLALTSRNIVAVFGSVPFGTALRFYTQGRRAVGSIALGGFADIEGGFLERHPTRPLLYLLRSSGDLFEINERTGAVAPIGNLRLLPIDLRFVWDVQSSRVASGAAGLIVPTSMTFGDFAIWAKGDRLDFFVAGTSVAHPFVMRIRFVQGRFRHARVLVMSRVTTAGDVFLPPGVAVSREGTVLTTLPVLGRATIIDAAITFEGNFAPNRFRRGGDARTALRECDRLPCEVPIVLFDRRGSPVNMPSRAIDADKKGNFYIASTLVGSADCLLGASGALITVPRNLRRFRCHPININGLNNATDIAVNANSSRVYMGFGGGFGGAILLFPIRP